MKNIVKYVIPASMVLIILISGCTKTVEQKIAGVWRIEEVKFDAAPGLIDAAGMEQTIESQKEILWELHEDHALKVKTGSTVLPGSWIFKEADNGIYVVFEGAYDTTLLGIVKAKKLVNEQKDPQISITTIFFKESKLKKEEPEESKN